MRQLQVLIVGVLVLLLGVQVAFAQVDGVTLNPKLTNFNQVVVSGEWEVVLKQGKKYNVQLTVSKNVVDRLEVVTRGKVLHLHLVSNHRWFNSDDKLLQAVITMPSLTNLRMSGQANVELSGFASKDFTLDSSGESKINGVDNQITNLFIVASGETAIDLEQSSVKNAKLSVGGESDIKLNMAGGTLLGRLSGESSVSYLGTINYQQVKTSGESTVTKK